MIYPTKCGICGKIGESYLCQKCYIKMSKNINFNIEKHNKEDFFNEHIYFSNYEGIIRKIIIDYKFNEKIYLVNTILEIILKEKKIFEFLKTYDTIIPVPISKKRLKERGFNQSKLICEGIINKSNKVQKVNLHLDDKIIKKKKNIIAQSKLNKEDRVNNVKGVYDIIDVEKIRGKSILLLDDIYTTGSTVKECCKIIKEGNPKKISVITIAKD